MDKNSLTCEVDPDWRDYDVSLTRGWARELHALTPKNCKLRPVVFALTADLRAISIAASFPNQLASSLSAFANGYLRAKSDPSPTFRVADAITRRLALKLKPRLNLSASDMAEIHGACLEIQSEVDHVQNVGLSYSSDDVWGEYMQAKGFQFGLWGVQRISFVAAYNAYDNFLTQCVALALKQPTYRRKRGDTFEAAIEQHFGAEAVKHCWRCDAVAVPREARHALSHYGGRETDELRRLTHDFPIRDRMIQVLAAHNKRLLRVIEDRATYLVTIARDLEQFRAKRKV
jgi:hypothetical protein